MISTPPPPQSKIVPLHLDAVNIKCHFLDVKVSQMIILLCECNQWCSLQALNVGRARGLRCLGGPEAHSVFAICLMPLLAVFRF